MHPVGREGSIITKNETLENIKQILENYINTTPPKYYPPVENLLDLIYETYTENNPAAPKTTAAGRAARARDKEFEAWLRETPRAAYSLSSFFTLSLATSPMVKQLSAARRFEMPGPIRQKSVRGV